MGALPNVFPAYQQVAAPEVRAFFEKAWGVQTLPGKPGLTIMEIMNAAHHGDIKGLYIMGENPMISDPDLSHAEESLKKLDFLVVQDIFLTETARLADVVLPSASFAEKEGTFTNTERRVQRVRKAVGSPGEALPDWEIIARIATRMGYPMAYGNARRSGRRSGRSPRVTPAFPINGLSGRGSSGPARTRSTRDTFPPQGTLHQRPRALLRH